MRIANGAWPPGGRAFGRRRSIWTIALAGLVALGCGSAPVRATEATVEYWPPRKKQAYVPIEAARQFVTREPAGPLLLVIDLTDQRLTAYDRDGVFATAPVSSGRREYETPEGVFSIIEKREDHYSNLYDDAHMPFMQRLTWSGVALHQGALPGYPASHGCVRLPGGFAEWLFKLTRLNTRVIVTPHRTTPAPISHAVLLDSLPVPGAGERRAELSTPAMAAASIMSTPEMRRQRDIAHKAALEARARLSATTGALESARLRAKETKARAEQAERQFHAAHGMMVRADDRLNAAERTLANARAPQHVERATVARDAAQKLLDEASRKADDLETLALDSAREARDAADAVPDLEAKRSAAIDEARIANRAAAPVSILISRKRGRLYVRQGFEPVVDVPVTIRNPEKPIGTHIFTAMASAEDSGVVSWTGITVEDPTIKRPLLSRRNKAPSSIVPSRELAVAALDRIELPPEIVTRILPALQPGSTLMISDRGPSEETGKGTDFVLLTNPEPVWIEEN